MDEGAMETDARRQDVVLREDQARLQDNMPDLHRQRAAFDGFRKTTSSEAHETIETLSHSSKDHVDVKSRIQLLKNQLKILELSRDLEEARIALKQEKAALAAQQKQLDDTNKETACSHIHRSMRASASKNPFPYETDKDYTPEWSLRGLADRVANHVFLNGLHEDQHSPWYKCHLGGVPGNQQLSFMHPFEINEQTGYFKRLEYRTVMMEWGVLEAEIATGYMELPEDMEY